MLLNKILNIPDNNKGFSTEDNDGLVMWSVPYYVKNENRLIYFVECLELNKNENDDVLLALIFSISSIVIFNVMGENFNDKALNVFPLMQKLNSFVNVPSKISHPKLFWVFRDVSEKTIKQIVDGNFSQNQLIDNKIAEIAKKNNEIKKYVQTMNEIFTEKKSFFLPKAIEGKNTLRKEFLDGVQAIKQTIHNETQSKILFENHLNSRMLLTFTNSAIESIKEQNIIDLNFWYLLIIFF